MLELASPDRPIPSWRRIYPIVAATLNVPLPAAPSVTFVLMSCARFSNSSLVNCSHVAMLLNTAL